ncbi:MAG: glycosyltransferase family 39 protein [candidate division Zixibacteria bacterium]|nr:glycosyltransferase family 39 protein [candidate division Zixibacteria bacterium]
MTEINTPSKDRIRLWLVPLCFILAAFFIRLVYLNQLQVMPTSNLPIMDEKYHINLAEKINTGETDPEPFFRAPLYPYFLAGLFKITGSSLYWSRFAQAVLGSLLPLLLYLFGLMIFNRKVAFWTAALAVFYPTFLYYDTSLLITSLMVLLTLILVWQLYRTQARPQTLNFIITGVLLGLTGLARPNILLLGPALFIWVWLVLKETGPLKKALLHYIIIGVAAFIIILPVTVRNYIVSGDPVLIAWQGGFNFYLGNNRQASGWSATVPGIDYSWEGGYWDAIVIAENDLKRTLKRSEVSDYWYDRAFDEIFDDPAAFLSLAFKKLRLFFNGYEIPNNQNLYFTREFVPILKPLMFDKIIYFPYGLVAPLALLGLGLTLQNWRKYLLIYLVLGSYLISLMLFFVCARFRQPVLPLMLLLAVFAIYRLAEIIRKKQTKNAVLLLFILALLVWESNHDLLQLDQRRVRAEDYFMLGAAELEYGRTVEAELDFQRAIGTDSTHGASYNNLGLIYANRKDYLRALPFFQKALRHEPMNPENYFNYATILMTLNDYNGAVSILERARQLHPLNYYVHYKLGMTYYQMGRLDLAESSLAESLRLNPGNDHARQLLQQIRQMKQLP